MKKPIRAPWSLKKIATRIRHGFGQGTLANYIPWIGIRDLSSKGTSTRMWSPKTGRKMQFLSNIERDTFLIAEFREDFVDYWEQWPLERNATRWAAEKLRYRHPIYVGTTIPIVMTVDGVLTLRKGSGTASKAVDCKHSSELDNPRTQEKLAIARLACEHTNLPHILVTEAQTPPQVVKNILWVRISVRKSGEKEPIKGTFDMWPMRMLRHLAHHQEDAAFNGLALNAYCKWFETEHRLPGGFGLRCMKLLMWQHLVVFDLNTQKPETMPLGALQVRRPLSVGAQRLPETA